MLEVSEKARDQMWQVLHSHKKEEEWSGVIVDLLSIPELAIVDRKASREFYDALHKVEVEIPEGWVKEVK